MNKPAKKKSSGSANKGWIVGAIIAIVVGAAAVVAITTSGSDGPSSDGLVEQAAVSVAGDVLPAYNDGDPNDPALGMTAPVLTGKGFTGNTITTESTGTLGLAVSAGVTYESWAITNGISGAAFTDDSDNDGIDNGTEYGIGGNPTSFTASAALVPAGSDYTLTYNKGTEAAADPQIDYAFETSPDLGIWTEVAPTAEDGTSVSYTLVKSGPKKFARLKIKRVIP